jgi:hypothetical protein
MTESELQAGMEIESKIVEKLKENHLDFIEKSKPK